MSQRRRIVVTGLGIVSPVGSTLESFWRRLTNGESGIGPITKFDASDFKARIAGEVMEFDPTDYLSTKELRRTDNFAIYGIAAADEAIKDSGLDFEQEDSYRVGVIAGSGIGGLDICLEQSKVMLDRGPSRFTPYMIPQMITNILAGHIAIRHGLHGPNFCITSACATGMHCLGESLRMIQHDEADIIVAGGSEGSVNELGIGGFCALKALSTTWNDDPTKASRPFDADRNGFVCGEGGGILILEELEHAKKRGAKIYCELSGYGRTCDAYHTTAPLPDGEGACRSMQLAVKDAGLNPEDVNYINAHGTSTRLNDKGETLAIKKALGEEHARKISISSTKSMTGHLLGAAGSLESIACALSIKNGAIPPTINYTTPDPDCDLDYTPNEARELKVKACLNNSLGFGGHNATLCFTAFED
ncbi:MAG: beta-ketoacyl-ACP synthase II [Verrucomicrobiota bacterium]